MKIALLGDIHAGVRNDSVEYQENCIKFFENVFFPYLQQNNIKQVIQLGDVFDRRKYININTLSLWKNRVFDKLNSIVDVCHIILGNHDCYYKNTNDINSVEILLKEYKNFIVYKEPEIIIIGNKEIQLVPWFSDDMDIITEEAIKNSQCEICVGHFDILDFPMYKGILNTEAGYNYNIFKNFKKVFSGHYHHASEKHNIKYVGTPYQITWNDFEDSRGFCVYDTETDEVSFIENPQNLFHKVSYMDGDLENFQQSDFSYITGNVVKLIVLKAEDTYSLDVVIDILNSYKPIELNVIRQDNDLIVYAEDVREDMDTIDIIDKCVKNSTCEYKEEVFELFKTIYKEAHEIC